MTDEDIERIALASGFELKNQPDGSMALHPYVFAFARALLAAAPSPEEESRLEAIAKLYPREDIMDSIHEAAEKP